MYNLHILLEHGQDWVCLGETENVNEVDLAMVALGNPNHKQKLRVLVTAPKGPTESIVLDLSKLVGIKVS